MRVFVTGATGFIGTAILKELINAAHQVLGLARLYTSVQKLINAGAEVHRSDLENLDSAIGKQLNLRTRSVMPEAAEEHFGWFAHMSAIDCPSSSIWTQEALSWYPTHSTLLTDIKNGV